MESQRSFLVIGLLMVSFLLWQQWQLDYGPKPVAEATSVQAESSEVPSASPNADDVPASPAATLQNTAAQTTSQKLVHVTTDFLDVIIDTKGGDIVSAKLIDYPVEQGSDEAFTLLSNGSDLHVAQSGLIGANGPDGRPEGRPQYLSTQDSYEMTGDSLVVPLSWQSENGLLITKNFIFTAGTHQVEVQYQVQNRSTETAQLQQYAQLKQTTQLPEGSMFMPTYKGTAYSTDEQRYEKYDFDDIEDKNLRETTKGGWVAMVQHYFVSAWVAPQEQTNNIYTRSLNNGMAIIGFTGTPVTVAPEQSAELSTILYVGPKDQDVLAELASGLDLTVEYGILWWISQPLFALLQIIHNLVGNWGLSIILITIIVKGAMYPLTKAQYTSMAKMRNLQPKMQALKERYGDDRQKMSQGMMELYRKEKVNPMGGCLPLLLQMPIFLALYWVFLESVELRHAEFFLWITDLSVMDPYFVLPVLTGASMYLLQKLQPMTMQDPMQQKIMQFMPVMMSIFFLWFPAGLVLYWLVSNIITIIQAKMIYSAMDKQGLKSK